MELLERYQSRKVTYKLFPKNVRKGFPITEEKFQTDMADTICQLMNSLVNCCQHCFTTETDQKSCSAKPQNKKYFEILTKK